jgi:predicted N-acetyltransferase YhbS
MKIHIQRTIKTYFLITENITRETFWNLYKPGCNEHLILHQLRESSSYIEELDLVAMYEGEIIGHVISTKARIVDKQSNEYEVLCVGPFSVSPSFQNKGIGKKLLNYSISEAKRMGFRGMILFGNPDYYHRFGFLNAKEYEITTKDNQNFEPFMALELQENGLANVKGRFFEDETFTIKEEELNKYEKKFPAKEKGKPKFDINL